MSNTLLLTKLFPPTVHSGLVSRPRLVGRVLDGWRQGRKLALFSAPPGFGKTTLVGEVIQLAGCRTAWLSIDSADNAPVRFWRYIIAAMRRLFPDLGELAQSMLEANQPPPVENILTSLLNELAVLPEPLIIILDDYHLIETTAVHESLNFFIDHLSPQVSLIITTRSDPPLSLARRRGRMEMTEIRAADLRFSYNEAVEFL
ncbi:MAG: AAA family ATPase, partial [Anaerolineaceae bacterium]|nr:AAA family ATPase [Anaerolineaceae bacterium]